MAGVPMTSRQRSTDTAWLKPKFRRDAFADLVRATATANAARDALWQSFEPHARKGVRVNWIHVYVSSASARALGLHDAVAREIIEDNPHAVFVLCRSLADLALVTLQVRRDPAYVHVVARDPSGASRGDSTPWKAQKLIAASRNELPGMDDLWDLLSDLDHFAWASFGLPIKATEEGGSLKIAVSTEPFWNPPEAKLTALQLLATLSTIIANTITRIFHEYPVGRPVDVED